MFLASLFALLALTAASQMEMLALGIMSNTGADFFTLFSSEKSEGRTLSADQISLADVEQKWAEIDKDQSGVISKRMATAYMTEQKDSNVLTALLNRVREKLGLGSSLGSLVTLLLSVAAFKAIWLFFSRYTTQLLAIRISRDLRQQYFEHIQSQPMSFYHQHNIGSISSRIVGDAAQIAVSINSCITNFLQTPFTILTTLGMCFYMSWKLSLVIFVGVPGIVLPIIFFARRVKKISRQLQTNQERFASVLIDFLAGIQTVKIFSMEAFSLRKYQEQNDRMAMLESKTAKYGLLTRPVLHAVTTLCLAGVVLFGLYTLHMTLPQLIVFCGLLQLVYEPVKKFAEENANVQRGVVAAERMYEVLGQKPLIQDAPGAIEMKRLQENIEFRNVWFRYQGDWVLKGLSFQLRKGETLAIVGPTGAGKSTIVQLLPRLYEAERGEILIDGRPVAAYTQKSLRDNIAFVSQKPFLFYDTVAANIAYGRDYSFEQIEEAARRAHADEFIQRLPKKYQSMLAEAGQNLSGGQQQRLAIARALVKSAGILILDEATSSLDALSEQKIKDAILSLKGEVTQILIAHRLSTIDHADRILYLEEGRKIAEGTKEELMVSCPQFRLMWETLYQRETRRAPQPCEMPL